MKKISRRSFLIASAALGLSGALAACGNAADSAAGSAAGSASAASAGAASASSYVQSKQADSVVVANGDPSNFQPVKMTGNAKNPLCLVYEALCDSPFGGDVYGVLAKKWDWDGDNLVVQLYDTITDSAGNKITANDVVFDYTWCYENGYTGSKFGQFCDSVTASDDHTVVFHFMEGKKDVYKGEFQILTGQYIFSQAAFESGSDQMATTPIGTGPYRLTSYTASANAVLEARDDYWQTDASAIGPQHVANVKKITFNFITDSSQIVNALLTGSIDYAQDVPVEAVAQFQSNASYQVDSSYLGKVIGMYPNCLTGCLLNDENIRLAIFYAMDNNAIVSVMGGTDYARPLSCYAVPGMKLYDTAWDTAKNCNTVCDLDLAKEYLAKSGYNGETLKIKCASGTYADAYEGVYMVLFSALESLGIQYDFEQMSDDRLSDLYKTVNSDWDLLILATGGDGSTIDYVRNSMNNDSYEGGVGNYYDDELNALFTKMFCNSGATQENVDALYAYIVEHGYAYGCVDPTLYSVYRNSVIKNAVGGVNYRNLIMPNTFVYAV